MDRKSFFKNLCLSGACLCGFGAMAKFQSDSIQHIEDSDRESITQLWLSSVLASVNPHVVSNELKETIKQGALVHYQQLNMDSVLTDYIGDLPKFISFLEKDWGWKVTYDPINQVVLADENKDFCVCPVIRYKTESDTSALCYCSEGFAEKMFSVISQKKAIACIEASVRRGDKSCVYKIVLNS